MLEYGLTRNKEIMQGDVGVLHPKKGRKPWMDIHSYHHALLNR